jgi:hypothetical protein
MSTQLTATRRVRDSGLTENAIDRPRGTVQGSRKMLIALGLVLIGHSAASAATLRTSPFNGPNVSRGFARCLVTNGSSVSGTAVVRLFSRSGDVLSEASDVLQPHQTENPTAAFDFSSDVDGATYCECTVPSAATWRCSFVYMDTLNGAPSVITNIDGK